MAGVVRFPNVKEGREVTLAMALRFPLVLELVVAKALLSCIGCGDSVVDGTNGSSCGSPKMLWCV